MAKTITAAESLTAGLFQASVADFPGASQVFKGGFVTYSLEEKKQDVVHSSSRVGATWSSVSFYSSSHGFTGPVS